MITELKKSNRAIEIKKNLVDAQEIEIAKNKNPKKPEFDDEHIVALLIVSRCKLLCTKDNGLINFIKEPNLKKHFSSYRPKIYCKLKSASILNKANIANIPKSVIAR